MTSLRVGPLVRAVNATSALIWVELPHADEVTLRATSLNISAKDDAEPHSLFATTRTIRVGNRFYAAPQLSGLRPGTWYRYEVHSGRHSTPRDDKNAVLPLQCFRTLNRPEEHRPLTLAYGSCRKSSASRQDALAAFGRWLVRRYDERETQWPRLLLLIGDQIYADEPSAAAVRFNAHLRGGAKDFTEFASLYEFAWTRDTNVRQALAVLPTYMMCDDHEITNNWNNQPFWRSALLRHQQNEHLLVDGLVAYWVYQAWGNWLTAPDGAPTLASGSDTPLHIMTEAAHSGEDALEPLREIMRRAVYGQTRLRWHYSVPTSPPLFVADARADREARFNKPVRRLDGKLVQNPVHAADEETPARIMSQEQMMELKDWLASHDSETVMLVSSVPVLLPPIIGFAEYIMGRRVNAERSRRWRWPLRLVGHLQQKVAIRTSFDHWPLFGATWKELVQLLASRQHDVLVLSGDVHFSYTMEARLTQSALSSGVSSSTRKGRRARLHQLVCSPLQNHLGMQSRRRILAQAWCQSATYGGLKTRVRHLHGSGNHHMAEDMGRRIYHNLLLGNTVAMVTFHRQEDGAYQVLQRYFGSHEGELKSVACSTLQTR